MFFQGHTVNLQHVTQNYRLDSILKCNALKRDSITLLP